MTTNNLSVISWNLCGLDQKHLAQRTYAVLSVLERGKFSIIFLQELTHSTFEFIQSRLGSKYLPVKGIRESDTRCFTAIFLRYGHVKFEDRRVFVFHGSPQNPPLLVVHIKLGESKLCVVNAHLENSTGRSKERAIQLQECFNLCLQVDADSTVIFGGSLNLPESEVENIVPVTMYDVWKKCGSQENRITKPFSLSQPQGRYDRFYVRDSSPPKLHPIKFSLEGTDNLIGTTYLPSDHWAITTEFSVAP